MFGCEVVDDENVGKYVVYAAQAKDIAENAEDLISVDHGLF